MTGTRMERAIRRIVVVGGGTAGWMTAAPLARRGLAEVVLVESPELGTIGVGEATLPPLRHYNRALGIDALDFVRRTEGSFKLGIEFRDWGWSGNRFFHGFGDFGPAIDGRSSFSHWLRLAHEGETCSWEDWSMATQMARTGRFAPPQEGPPSAHNAFSYAYHFDAALYAAYLREYALAHGAQRVEGHVVDVQRRGEDGFVAALKLRDGRRIEGDLFVDCSGFRALLIGGACGVPFEDWSALLPCDSALAVPSARAATAPLTPYTRSTARPCGWQWRIPLQHRTGNGHVYCSAYMGDDAAARVLLDGLDTAALDTPRQLRFKTGRRRESWVRNVVAIGLAAGFLEPLESTSIQLIMDGVGRLIELFPERDCAAPLRAEYNRRMARQYESIRDFIVLHYKLNRRDDGEFWRYVREMTIPDTLAHQIELFRSSGRVVVYDPDSFAEPSWVSLLMGLGATPQAHDPLADRLDGARLREHFARLREAIAQTAAAMPEHGAYIARYCSAAAGPKNS